MCAQHTPPAEPRAPHSGLFPDPADLDCQVWGAAPAVSSAQAGVWQERDQGAGKGSESMHRHPPNQGFIPQKAKGLQAMPEEGEQEQRWHSTANVHIPEAI